MTKWHYPRRRIPPALGLLILLTTLLATASFGINRLRNTDDPAAQDPAILAIGGISTSPQHTLLSGGMQTGSLSPADYHEHYDTAEFYFQRGLDFRLDEISILPADTIESALQNYADYNDGEWFFAFCSNYDEIDEHGFCPENSPEDRNIRNDLLKAIEHYAVLLSAPMGTTLLVGDETVPAQDLGRRGLVNAAREIANIHLIFGNEFLIDATDYRFTASGIPNADTIISQELEQLEAAYQQFSLASDVLYDAFNRSLYGQIHSAVYDTYRISETFDTDDFELFGVVSNRMMTALAEISRRYHTLGRIEDAIGLYEAAYESQYVQAMAIAQQADALGVDYLKNGSWEMLNNLSQMRERVQSIRDGADPFGFAPDYAPLQSYADLLELTEGPSGNAGLLRTARDLEDQARVAQRQFDENRTALLQELDDLEDTFNQDLFDLCGTDTDTCSGGLMGQNLADMKAASQRVYLAWQRAQNIAQQIAIEEERAGQVINVILGLGQQISAAELAIGKLESYRETFTQIESSEDRVYAGVEVSARTEVKTYAKVSANPLENDAGVEASFTAAVEGTAGYEQAHTSTTSAEVVWDPNAQAIASFESMKALKEAEANAAIEGANSAAVIKNLLIQQSELLLEYEIAVQEFNKLAAEHNHLTATYSRLHNLLAESTSEIIDINGYRTNPAYRVMRDTLTVQATDSLELASQFAYLTARAVEYELLTPYPALKDIYKARTANDIRLFLDNLKVFYQGTARPGQLNRYPYTISLAKDIWGLTDQYLDPDGILSPEQLAQLRYEQFQTRLQTYIDNNNLEINFASSLEQRRTPTLYLFSPNIWGNRISGIGEPLPSNQGVSVNLVTRQNGMTGIPEVKLIHGGQASYRDPQAQIVYYDPGTAVPIGYKIPPSLNPANTTVVLRPGVNGQGAITNSGLINLSVAASNWLINIPDDSRGDLDYNLLQDIEILVDTTGRALSGRAAEAAEDSVRLQAGQELLPSKGWSRPDPERAEVPAQASTQRLQNPNPGGMLSGAYEGTVNLRSPLPVGVQELAFDLVDSEGVLSGVILADRAVLFPNEMTVQGSRVGDTSFALQSSTVDLLIDDHVLTMSFALNGGIDFDGRVVHGNYTGIIQGYLPDPLIIEGVFSASRPNTPGSPLRRLMVQAESQIISPGGSTLITAQLLDSRGEPVPDAGDISFSATLGLIDPAVVTPSGGTATATYTAGNTPGVAIISARSDDVMGQTSVRIEDPAGQERLYLPSILH